ASASSDGSTACDKNCPCNKCNAKVRSLLVEDIPHILADNLGGEDMNKFSCGQLCTMLSGMLHIPEDRIKEHTGVIKNLCRDLLG
ncbi:unnamed protein product, partial [Polarella glacialis]